MPQVVYLQIGSSNFEQFRLAVASVRRMEPGAEIVLYTDQQEDGMEGVVVRPWRVEGATDLARCGTADFAQLTQSKIHIMRHALAYTRDFIIFSDVDVVACKPFASAAQRAAERSPVSISSEGDGRIPMQLCSGFIILRQCEAADAFLNAWERHHEGLLEEDPTLHDQDALNHLLEHDRAWHDVCTPLPMLFCAPGWLYQAIVPLNMLPLVPFFFHANWLFEAEKKAARMRAVTAVYGRKKRSITNRIYGLIRYTTHQFARLFIER